MRRQGHCLLYKELRAWRADICLLSGIKPLILSAVLYSHQSNPYPLIVLPPHLNYLSQKWMFSSSPFAWGPLFKAFAYPDKHRRKLNAHLSESYAQSGFCRATPGPLENLRAVLKGLPSDCTAKLLSLPISNVHWHVRREGCVGSAQRHLHLYNAHAPSHFVPLF